MKKQFLLSASLLISSIAFSQVGVGTTTPTATLDVNGTFRVRSQFKGTPQTDFEGNQTTYPARYFSQGLFRKDASVINTNNVSTITRIAANRYNVVFYNTRLNTIYSVFCNADGRYCQISNRTANGFDITVSSTTGNYEIYFIVIELF